MWRCVYIVHIDVSEERIASIFRVEEKRKIRVRRTSVSRLLQVEAIRSSETSVYTMSTRHHIPEEGILHSHRRENLKSYIDIENICLKIRLCYKSYIDNCHPFSISFLAEG
jgi:hypothetical protein